TCALPILLIHVHALQIVAAGKMLLAQAAQIGDRPHRACRRSGDVEPQHEAGALGGGRFGVGHDHAVPDGACCTSRPTRTRSEFDRSPMIRLIGGGRRRTSVGIATIWSLRASSGLAMRSMTSTR